MIKGKGRGSQHNKVHHRFWLGTWHTVCQNWVCKQREGFQRGEKLIIQYDGLEISVNSDTVKSAYDNHLVRTLNKVRWISNTIIAISQCLLLLINNVSNYLCSIYILRMYGFSCYENLSSLMRLQQYNGIEKGLLVRFRRNCFFTKSF